MKFSSARPWESFNSLFSFVHEDIEKEVEDKPGHYLGHHSEALYTSLVDFYRIMHHPSVKGHWVDLGAGIGSSALLYASLFPDRQAQALEISKARIEAGRRIQKQHEIHNAQLLHCDLLHDPVPVADTYFLYFPTGIVLDRILNLLYLRQHPFTLIAIESHGDLLSRLEQERWLKPQGSMKLESVRHHPEAIFYGTNFSASVNTHRPFDISFQAKYLFIKELDQEWIGESFGLTYHAENKFDLLTPPRTIEWSSVQKVADLHEIPQHLRLSLGLRRLGELQISTPSGKYAGIIRKITVKPGFSVEISTGEKIEWAHILSIYWGTILCYDSSLGFSFLPVVPL